MVKRLVLKKRTFPHVVSTSREDGGAHHHEFGTWLHASAIAASQHLAERAQNESMLTDIPLTRRGHRIE
jgi:hypothetical protein